MMKTTLQISPQIIHWVADLKHKTPNELAEELMPKKVDEFLQGILSKTIAVKLAKLANTPFGYLFLSSPPQIPQVNIPDLRQVIGAEPLSQDFIEVLQDIEYKQTWFRDFLIENGQEQLGFIGKFTFHARLKPNEVAPDILKTLGISDLMAAVATLKKEDYLKFLITEFEKIGILVFKNGVVKNNNNRPLNIQEFRGFALADPFVPVVFINGADAPAAQLFTLIHEVAHIWVGQSGVSNWQYEQGIETFCNQVAAEVLMPEHQFYQYWEEDKTQDDNIEMLSKQFKMSRLAVIIRAVILKLLDFKEIHQERECLKEEKESVKKRQSGGGFYRTLITRESPRFTHAVVQQAMSQHIPLREASRLLNISASTLISLHQKIKGE